MEEPEEPEEFRSDKRRAAVLRLVVILIIIDCLAIIGVFVVPVFIFGMDAFLVVLPVAGILGIDGVFYLFCIMRLQGR